MARTFRVALALSALSLSSFAGLARAEPSNPNSGPPPSPSDPCLDIVSGLGNYVINPLASVPVPAASPYPGATIVVATNGTLNFDMTLAAASCTKAHYTLNVFSDPTTAASGTELVPARQVATASQRGTGASTLHFTVPVTDVTTSLRDTSNPCVNVQGVTMTMGQTVDVAPNTGTLHICTTNPGTAGFN